MYIYYHISSYRKKYIIGVGHEPWMGYELVGAIMRRVEEEGARRGGEEVGGGS